MSDPVSSSVEQGSGTKEQKEDTRVDESLRGATGSTAATAVAGSDPIREALEDMVYQFGYEAVKNGRPALGTGGLSALEGAFDALGWDDPYVIPDPVWCDAPVTPRCPRAISQGTPTLDGYQHFCCEHGDIGRDKYQAWRAAGSPALRGDREAGSSA